MAKNFRGHGAMGGPLACHYSYRLNRTRNPTITRIYSTLT